MKYKVTEKHSLYKEGLIIKEYAPNNYGIFINDYDCQVDGISFYEIEDLLTKGWIEEIQEPEFTRDDMKLFGAQCAQEWQKHKLLYTENELDKFIKNK